MANHKSAKKRARQSIKKQGINNVVRKTVSTYEKKLKQAVNSKDNKLAKELFTIVQKKTDKATQKGLFHANKAARKVARWAQKIEKLTE